MVERGKISLLFFLQIVVFLLLGARLVDLQLIKGERNRILADENRVLEVVLPAGRGIIYDRQGRQLVENIPLYFYGEGEEEEEISRQQALEIESRGALAAAKVKVKVGRKYLWPEGLAHLLGYTGQVSKEEVLTWTHLRVGDFIGRGGVEEEYDSVLRGKRGLEIFEVDALGEKVRTVGKVAPQAGRDLRLSVDAELSKTAWEALKGRPGAVVVTEAKTGKIIVLVSSPGFDPNKLSLGITTEDYQEILEDPQKPFFNRAIGGAYPPGSTFKIVTAVAGLEEGEITSQTLIEDTGQIKVGDFVYKNWYFSQYGGVEGEINLVRAIKRSTDTYFYKVGEWVGARKLADWARFFGLGQVTGINLPGEVGGLVPDPEWKEEVRGERWFLGNTYHFAIGQADLTTTPLQVNMLTGVIANSGTLCPPRVGIEGEEEECWDLKLKKETLALVKEGMEEACLPGGTATPLFDFKPPVSCKTGTAQFGDPEERTHAWLTAFAPAEEPEVVITVLLEAGGEGSKEAAPVVAEILRAWFKD